MERWRTTTTLLERLRGDADDGAWNQLDERLRPALEIFARRMGLAPADVADVVQESLLALMRALRDGSYDRGRGRLRSFLFGVVRNQVKQAQRRAHKDPPGVAAAEPLADDRAEQRTFDESWETGALAHCLAQVEREVHPRTYRAFDAVVLRHRKPADVARELAMSVNAVYLAKHRVLGQVRERMAELDAAE